MTDSPRLANRVALVTGASRGIGRAVAVGLAREGAHVVLLARTTGGLEEVDDEIRAAGGTATLVTLDLRKPDKVDALGTDALSAVGQARHSRRQCRRARADLAAAAHHRRRLERGDRRQPDRQLAADPIARPAAAARRRRPRGVRVLGRRHRQERLLGPLRRLQGGPRGAGQDLRQRGREHGHQGQHPQSGPRAHDHAPARLSAARIRTRCPPRKPWCRCSSISSMSASRTAAKSTISARPNRAAEQPLPRTRPSRALRQRVPRTRLARTESAARSPPTEEPEPIVSIVEGRRRRRRPHAPHQAAPRLRGDRLHHPRQGRVHEPRPVGQGPRRAVHHPGCDRQAGTLRPGGTIVEGTAGNTGIGLAVIGNALGYRSVIVIPETQSAGEEGRAAPARRRAGRGAGGALQEPQQLREVFGAPRRDARQDRAERRHLGQPVRQRRQPPGAHRDDGAGDLGRDRRQGRRLRVGGRLRRHAGRRLDGPQGQATRTSRSRSPMSPGAALYSYYTTGELKSEGSSITEGIGQGRITANLEGAVVDHSYLIPDAEGVAIVFQLLQEEGLCLGVVVGRQRRRRHPPRARDSAPATPS